MSMEMLSLLTFAMTSLVILLTQATFGLKAYGLKYFMGNRDISPDHEDVLAQRFRRIVTNTIETGYIFIALVLVAAQLGVSNELTSIGSIVFTASRVLYPFIYAIGIPVVRTLVWDAGIIALFAIFAGIVSA